MKNFVKVFLISTTVLSFYSPPCVAGGALFSSLKEEPKGKKSPSSMRTPNEEEPESTTSVFHRSNTFSSYSFLLTPIDWIPNGFYYIIHGLYSWLDFIWKYPAITENKNPIHEEKTPLREAQSPKKPEYKTKKKRSNHKKTKHYSSITHKNVKEPRRDIEKEIWRVVRRYIEHSASEARLTNQQLEYNADNTPSNLKITEPNADETHLDSQELELHIEKIYSIRKAGELELQKLLLDSEEIRSIRKEAALELQNILLDSEEIRSIRKERERNVNNTDQPININFVVRNLYQTIVINCTSNDNNTNTSIGYKYEDSMNHLNKEEKSEFVHQNEDREEVTIENRENITPEKSDFKLEVCEDNKDNIESIEHKYEEPMSPASENYKSRSKVFEVDNYNIKRIQEAYEKNMGSLKKKEKDEIITEKLDNKENEMSKNSESNLEKLEGGQNYSSDDSGNDDDSENTESCSENFEGNQHSHSYYSNSDDESTDHRFYSGEEEGISFLSMIKTPISTPNQTPNQTPKKTPLKKIVITNKEDLIFTPGKNTISKEDFTQALTDKLNAEKAREKSEKK